MSIQRQTIYDDAGQPVAVVIPIHEWERIKNGHGLTKGRVDLSQFHGIIDLGGRDALEMQEEMRREWDRDDPR